MLGSTLHSNFAKVAILLGFASAVVDNVPLVAAAQALDGIYFVHVQACSRMVAGHVRHKCASGERWLVEPDHVIQGPHEGPEMS